MIAYAAIDLRGRRVVQLVGGRPEAERVSLPDPAAAARRWADAGFQALHVVDLDAALGQGNNLDAIAAILGAVTLPVQVGGGVRDDAAAGALIEAGAARIIAGTRAVEDPAWVATLAARHPGRVVVAADMRDGELLTRGWTAGTGRSAESFLRGLDPLPLGGVLVTDVGREGRLLGADVERFARLASASRHPLVAAGGIASIGDLHALAGRGVAGAVLGMALYTGAIDPEAAAREFAG